MLDFGAEECILWNPLLLEQSFGVIR